LRLVERNEVLQLVDDIASNLEMVPEPSASYQEAVDLVVAKAKALANTRAEIELVRHCIQQGAPGIDISSIRINPATALLGEPIHIMFDITSTLSATLDAWLGADVPYGADKYFFNAAQDISISIAPGRQVYSRDLTLRAPLTAGSWVMNAGVWVGVTSEPERSARIALPTVDITIS
jgi:hypothetical protein